MEVLWEGNRKRRVSRGERDDREGKKQEAWGRQMAKSNKHHSGRGVANQVEEEKRGKKTDSGTDEGGIRGRIGKEKEKARAAG